MKMIKRSIILSTAAMALSLPLSAGVTIDHIGTNNTLVRVSGDQKYLILPVQESMPDAKIEIIVDGNIVNTVYVRLADSNIDYTVPLDITPYTSHGELLLNVVSEVDRAHSRNASDYICWEDITMSDDFDTSNREKYRPAYHHTPLYGWMNDPNGMFYKDGVWHLYYQYNPYGSKWQNMTWGHSTSTDLVNWEHMSPAIRPNGLGSIFSGSCVVDTANTSGLGENTVVAIYTSCANNQVQSMSYSHDNGRTFTFYPGSPVIPNPTEARDPNMFWHEPTQQWVLVLAHALDKEMQIYTSPDLIEWTLQSAFGKGYGSQDGVWECPDLFELPVAGTDQKKWVLLCNINPGAPMGGSGTQYFIGDFDGRTFTPDDGPEVSKWMDYGKDHYATVTWSNAPDDRRTAIGWMSNWQYANEVPTMQYRSANTLPRELGLFRGDDGEIYLSSTPSPELESLRADKASHSHLNITPRPVTFEVTAQSEIVIDYDARKCDFFNIILSNDKGEEVVMSLDAKGRQFSVDRTRSGLTDFSAHFPAKTVAPTHAKTAKGTLRIFIDNCSVEVFDGEGRFVLTNLVFPTTPYDKVSLQSAGGNVKVDRMEIYSLTNKN